MKTKILNEIIKDLADNYRKDGEVLNDLLDDVIVDALSMSNRKYKSDIDNQLLILKSNIKKAVKTIYLQRGAEDVSSKSESGQSSTYDSAMETMQKDILRQNKRIMI